MHRARSRGSAADTPAPIPAGAPTAVPDAAAKAAGWLPSGTHAALSPAVVGAGLVLGVAAVSTAAVLIRIADAPALAIAFWRCAGGAAALAPFAVRARRGNVAPLDTGQRRALVAAGAFLALHFGLFVSSLSYTSVAASSVLVAMSPLFVGLGAALFLREPPSRLVWAGIGLAAVGAVVVALAGAGDPRAGGRTLLGNALAFGGAAAVAGYLLLGRVARQRLPVVVYATVVYGVAAVLLLGACLVTGAPLGVVGGGYSAGTWLAIAGLIVGPQLLGHTIFNTLLSTVTATTVAVVVLAEPVGATLLALLLLGELPAALFWAGAPLVLAGVFLAGRGRSGQLAAERDP